MCIILSPITRLLSVLPIIPAVGKDREQTVLFDITCDIIVSNLKRFEAKRVKFILENICRLFAQQMMRWEWFTDFIPSHALLQYWHAALVQ